MCCWCNLSLAVINQLIATQIAAIPPSIAAQSIIAFGGNGAVTAVGDQAKRWGSNEALFTGLPSAGAVADNFIRAPFDCNIDRMFYDITAAFGAGIGVDAKLWINEIAPSALVCNIQGAAQVSASELVTVVPANQGDRITTVLTRNPGIPGPVRHAVIYRLRPR